MGWPDLQSCDYCDWKPHAQPTHNPGERKEKAASWGKENKSEKEKSDIWVRTMQVERDLLTKYWIRLITAVHLTKASPNPGEKKNVAKHQSVKASQERRERKYG